MSLTLTQNVLNKNKCNHNIFIETGTHKGGSVELALQCNFEKIYTIDISTQHKLYCENKFKEQIYNGKIQMLLGDTIDVLPNIIDKLTEPALFWLDSHFDGHSDTCGKFKCPILQELEIIKSSKIKNHTIMVDDIRIFNTQSEWASGIYINNIIEKLKEINENYTLFYENGYVENDILVAKL